MRHQSLAGGHLLQSLRGEIIKENSGVRRLKRIQEPEDRIQKRLSFSIFDSGFSVLSIINNSIHSGKC